ncbi:hypothetical protein [Nocardia sp. NPDC051463]
MKFVVARGLDMDAETWPDADRGELEVLNRALVDEWKRQVQQLIDNA